MEKYYLTAHSLDVKVGTQDHYEIEAESKQDANKKLESQLEKEGIEPGTYEIDNYGLVKNYKPISVRIVDKKEFYKAYQESEKGNKDYIDNEINSDPSK
jgi:phenylacetate-coenzyme A ligase PaaK-like adenylate-forming protein